MKAILILLSVSVATCAVGQVRHETDDLTGPDPNRSVAMGTLLALEADGIVDNKKISMTHTWMRELAQQKLSNSKMRRVYLVVFSLSNGEKVQAVAQQNESAIPEQSGLIVYVVSKVLQPDGKPVPRRQ